MSFCAQTDLHLLVYHRYDVWKVQNCLVRSVYHITEQSVPFLFQTSCF